MSQPEFYSNDVLDQRFEWVTSSSEDAPSSEREGAPQSVIRRCVAAAVVSAVLTFGPLASAAFAYQDKDIVVDRVVVRVRTSALSDVPIPAYHRSAAERFSRMFRVVPLSSAEQEDDPDYGL